jgi:hypothetical protein
MKAFAVLLVTIVAVNAGSQRLVRRQAGWGAPPPTPGWSTTTLPPTTTGWPAPPPTTTPGWPAPPPTTTPGWPAPPPPTTTPGWSAPPPPPPSAILTNINLDAALAAAGSGWAGENHSDNVQVVGAGGWGPNAALVISSSGISDVDQAGAILQATSQDAQSASSLNNIAVSQLAEGAEGQSLDALGLSISNEQSGWSAANGEGASAAAGDSILQVLPIASSLGMAKP